MIPLSVPNLKGNELKYVTEAVEAEWVSTGGSFINKFENDIANYLKVEQAVATQSGTAGLHLALNLAEVERGDEVIVPTLTFIATVNPVKYIGAEPIFMDCDETLNMDIDKLEKFCETECYLSDNGLVNKKTNKVIRAVVIVHVFGNMANMEKLMEVATKYNLKVVEDATEALGTYYTSGKYVNKFSGTIGDFGIYSFNGNKIITTGGGGMLVAKDKSLAEKARYLSTQAKDDSLYYIHNEVGYNYRMTNVQAAIGVAQLEKLEEFIHIKKTNYELYKKSIDEIQGLSLLNFNKGTRANYWFYSLLIENDNYGIDMDSLLLNLNENSVQTRPIWGLIHKQSPYLSNQNFEIEKATKYIDNVLNLPCSSNLTREEVLRVTDILKNLKS
ncbi:LegC family aminotransferase [Oceanobacillus massiliensis]|uniref:LegC family aminotransferase n=1 Tax=Oceanobacillus massiliensis TaxID=1465765 RepID=UPI000289C961|nr:LegC family aminotransferase [Oceanobacillus massiliensis]